MVKVFIEKNVRGVADNSGVHLADLKIQIQEGQQFFVRRVECAGNKTVRDDLIWRTLGLKIGLPFNPKDIEKSIKRLDRLGKFEKINREDVEISVNEVEHFVDVAFYLKEKVRQ
jgi:outer membrane protein insertion porin family